MFRGNLQRTGYYPTKDQDFRGEIAWKHIVVDGEFKAPAMVHAGTVFCGSTGSNEEKNRFWALDAQTGKLQWSHLLENEIRLTPCAGYDFMIVADGDVLRAFDIDFHFEQWAVRMKGIVDSVTVYGKMVFVWVRDTVDEKNFLEVFHLQTSEKIWERKFASIMPCYPTFADGTLFLATQSSQLEEMVATGFLPPRLKHGHLFAFDCATGDYKWRETATPGPIVGTPIWQEDLLYVPYREGITVHDAQRGKRLRKWTFGGGRINAPAAIKGELLLCTLSEGVVAKNIRTGRRAWEFRVPVDVDARFHDLVHMEETASAVSIMGETAVVGMKDGYLYGIDLRTGKNIWKCELDELIEGDMDHFQVYPKWLPVCGENMIYIAAGNTLYALR